LSAIDVDLQRMKDQPGHGQGAVASFSHRHKLRLRAVVGDVDVLCLLLSNRAFPFWITTAGAIIVTDKDARVIRKGEDFLDRVPQHGRIAAWKVATCRPAV